MTEQLTINENTRLRHCEAVIEKSMNSFYEMGIALREVRDGRLYKEEFSDFEDYCESKWGMTKRYVNYQISASSVLDNLGTIVPILPKTESQVRPLTKIEDPEKQQQAWQEVINESSESHEPITAKKVEHVVQKYCEPCINASIEFRRVFYLTPYYDKKLEDLMRGEKESTYLRKVIEEHCDKTPVKKAV
jgi:hypothetical protein